MCAIHIKGVIYSSPFESPWCRPTERERIDPQTNPWRGRAAYNHVFTLINSMNQLFNFIFLEVKIILIKINVLR